MYTISQSAATSTLIARCVSDFPFTTLYSHYALKFNNEESLTPVTIMLEDQSIPTEVFQQFIVTGSTVAAPIGQYNYELYTASGSSEADIIYTKVLERGTLRIEG